MWVSWSEPRSCFPPEVLSRHGPPLLRWVRVPSPFPTIFAPMRPSDSPDASAPLRSSLGVPYQLGKRRFCADGITPPGRPSDRLPPTARRSGSPVLRRPDLPTGRTGVSQVTGPSSSTVPQSITPPVSPRLALSPRGVLPSGFTSPWASGSTPFRGCFPAAHPLACLRINRSLAGNDCKAGYQPAGYALTGWGSHPHDDSSEFRSTSSTSSPTGIAWSLPETGVFTRQRPHASPHPIYQDSHQHRTTWG